MGMAIKEYFKMMKEMFRYLILIPFIPFLYVLMRVLGKSFEANSNIPEDLDEQERMANNRE